MGKQIFAVALSLGMAFGVWADDDDDRKPVVAHQAGADQFIAGETVTVNQPVAGDLFTSGGSIDIDADVGGDIVAMGGKLRIGADVAQSVYAAGGQVTISSKVGRNVRVAGGEVEIGPRAQILGNVSAAGGQLKLLGPVAGYVQAAGGRIYIDSAVSGDVDAASGRVELGPNARIAGTLRYRSGKEITQDAAAQVLGGVERLAPRTRASGKTRDVRFKPSRVGAGLWALGLTLLAGVLLGVLPRFFGGVAETLRARWGMSLLIGFVLLVCVPVVALMLLVSVIGIPLGLLAIALYLALLPVGYVSAGICLGDWGLQRFKADQAGRLAWRVGAAMLGVAVIALLGWVPWLGVWVGLAALLIGVGALALQSKHLVNSLN